MSLVCVIPLVASLFSACGPASPLAVGYVEGEFVLLAPIEVTQVQYNRSETRRPRRSGLQGRRDGKRRRRHRGCAGRGGACGGRSAACRPQDRQAAGGNRGSRCHGPLGQGAGRGGTARARAGFRPVQARHRHAGPVRRSQDRRRGGRSPDRAGRGQSGGGEAAGSRRDHQRGADAGPAGKCCPRAGEDGGFPSDPSKRLRRAASTT